MGIVYSPASMKADENERADLKPALFNAGQLPPRAFCDRIDGQASCESHRQPHLQKFLDFSKLITVLDHSLRSPAGTNRLPRDARDAVVADGRIVAIAKALLSAQTTR